MKNSYNKTAFDTLTNAWADLILMPLLFIRMPILTKNLAPEEYGLWGLVFTTCSLSLTLTSLGLGSALSRFLPSNKSKENIQEGFYSVLIIKTLLSLFLSISFFVLSQIFISDFDNNSELVKITSLLILLTTIQPVYSRLLKIFRKIKTLSTLKIIEGYGLVILYASILLNGYGLIHLLYSYLLVKTGIIIFLIIYLWPKTGIKWPKFTLLKEYFSYGLPTLPSSISFWIVNLSDRYIIVYLLGASSLGIYSAAYVIGSIPHMVSSLINFIMLVALSELYDKGEIEKVKAHLRYSAKYYFGLTIPFIFGSIICSKELLRILSTEEISSNGWFIVPIIAIAYLFLGIYNLLNYILLITKKTKILAVVWIIAMPLNIILNILIIPYYGLIGAAITTALSYFIAMCVTAFFSLKELTFSIDIGFILKSVVSSSIMGVFLIMFQPIGLLQMLICIVLALVIYTISLIILRSFNKNEYDLAKNLFGKIISFK